MKFIEFLLPCVAVLLALLFGCDTKDEGPAKPTVALVMKSLANEFFKTMEDGARAHAKENEAKYDLKVVGIKDEIDVSQQIKYVELMMAQGVDAIVIAPADSKSLVPVCKKAMDAGVVVVNIDNKLDDAVLQEKGVSIPFVGPDNRAGAKLAGDYVATKLKAGDQVAIIEGAPNTFNGIQRKLGFEDAMKAAKINIVSSQSGYWEPDKANRVVAGIVTEHADLKALLCSNDSMALGAHAALKAANKLSSVLIVGYDNIKPVQTLIKNGEVVCTIDQHADQLAVFGIEYALEMLEKKTTPADKQTPVDLITVQELK